MRWGIGGDYSHRVSTIGQQTRVPRIELVGNVVLQQLPVVFVVTAVVNRVDEIVVIIVVRGPAHGNIVTIFDRRRRRVETHRCCSRSASEWNSHAFTRRLLRWYRSDASANLHADILDHRRDVLRQIVERDTLYPRSSAARTQRNLPLHEAGWRDRKPLAVLQVDLCPRAPVAIGIIDIAAASKEIKVARAAHLRTSPLR